MINDQIYLWISKNKHIYFHQQLKRQLQSLLIYNYEVEFQSLMRLVVKQFVKEARYVLIDRMSEKAVCLEGFIMFWSQRLEQGEGQKMKRRGLQYRFCGSIRNFIGKVPSNRYIVKEKEKSIQKSIVLRIANSINIPQKIIQELLAVFVKAILNLLNLGNQLKISLQFCQINLSKKKATCLFSKPFLQQLNNLSQQPNNQNLKLYLCPHDKCLKKAQNNDQLINKTQRQKWHQIKQGNLFDRPSLVEIEQHFNKGRRLLLKYRDQFSD